jgi:ketosteroid isomerase-like protein
MTPTEFIHEYESSNRVHGLDHTLSLIDDNALYWFSDGSSHVGKRAIERVLRKNYELIQNEDYRISEIVWVAESSDLAACTYRFDWSGTVRGAFASGSGRGTSIIARRGNSWAVVHEHLSRASIPQHEH